MDIRIIDNTISREELKQVAEEFYRTMVKGVVDVEREIVAVGGEYHIDANNVLLEHGSQQEDLWGFNYHLERERGDSIEYTALINIRPAQDNPDMEVRSKSVREKMRSIITKHIV